MTAEQKAQVKANLKVAGEHVRGALGNLILIFAIGWCGAFVAGLTFSLGRAGWRAAGRVWGWLS